MLLSLVSKSNGRPYLKTVQDQMATVTERVVPIQLEGAAVGNPSGGASSSQASKAPFHLPNEGRNTSKRRSLIVTHEDGSRDEIHGLVTKLSSSSDDIHGKSASGVNIQEIGADTLRREIRRSRSGSRSKEDDPRNGFQPIISSNSSVRLVPIKMPDGRIVSRDPDETMEIKTEFTNYCHQEFPDKSPDSFETRKGRSRRKSGMSPSSSESNTPTKERIVPIQLETGEKFMPRFTKLDDLEPPEWSAFSPKYKSHNQTVPSPKPGQSPVKSALKQDSNPFKEKIVPIRVEGVEPIPKPRSSPTSVLDSPRRSALDRSKDRGGKRSTEKKVHHTVRFNVDDDPYEDVLPPGSGIAKTTRSSSLDSKYRNHLPPNGTSSERTRHRSGGSATEKTLHEIDCDINKIWKELQELETFPPAPSLNGKPPVVGGSLPSRSPYTSGLRNGSPIRRGQTAPVTPTPVKIRTYTTPTASVVASPASAPASRPTSPYMDSIVPATTSIVSTATNTAPLSMGTNQNGTTGSPTPWRPSSAMSSPLASSSYMTYKTSSQYNPRRDLGPTRPGSITPIVRKISAPPSSASPHPTSSASSSLQSPSPGSLATSNGGSSTTTSTTRPGTTAAVGTSTSATDAPKASVGTSATTHTTGSSTNGTMGQNSVFNYGNNNNNHKTPNQPTKVGASVSSQTSGNRNSGVEFFPRFEERPRENSLSRGQLIEEADNPSTLPSDDLDARGTPADLMANAEDKSTQTETSALSKSSKNKCSVQ